MTEFKQIIGRGTRVREDFGKMFFAIMDFRNATRLFYDPEFDGVPVPVYEPKPDESPVPPEVEEDTSIEGGRFEPRPLDVGVSREIIYDPDTPKEANKYYVNGIPVDIIYESVKYYDKDGVLITVSLKDFTRQNIQKLYTSLDDFLSKWNHAERKAAIIAELVDQGVFIEELQERVGKDLDLLT